MDDAFVGEIRAVPWDWTPDGWLPCNGGIYGIMQYQALFAVLGTTYGGDGKTTFAVPNLQGLTVCGTGAGPNLTQRTLAQTFGSESVTLNGGQMPAHNHGITAGTGVDGNLHTAAPSAKSLLGRLSQAGQMCYGSTPTPTDRQFSPATIGPVGLGQAHENRQPFLTMNYIICWDGDFPVHE